MNNCINLLIVQANLYIQRNKLLTASLTFLSIRIFPPKLVMNNTPITKLHVSIINIKLTTTHPKLQVAQQNSKSKTTVVYAKANNNLPSNALFLQL